MSSAVLSNLRDYLCGTLTPDNMLWLSKQLSDYAQQHLEEEQQYLMAEAV